MSLSFILQYLRHPRSVGAVKASSPFLAEKMVEGMDFAGAKCIVELGAGTGAFTERIMAARRSETPYLIFEINDAFFETLREKYGGAPNVYLFHESAEALGARLQERGFAQADYILSGLPFASLPKKVSERILEACRTHLTAAGEFITFQYTQLKMPLLHAYFPTIRVERETRNVPPAYIMHCKTGREA